MTAIAQRRPGWRRLFGGTLAIGVAFACLLAAQARAAEGDLDSAFSSDGIVTTPMGSGSANSFAVAMESSGRIFVAGSASNGTNQDFALACYHPDGTLDTTF